MAKKCGRPAKSADQVDSKQREKCVRRSRSFHRNFLPLFQRQR